MMTISNLSAGYANRPVLKNLSFSIKPSALTILIGPNGSGKSTLLKVLARLLPPSAGEIRLDGENLRDFARKALARKLAFLPQNRDLPSLSVYAFALHGRYPHLGFPRTPGKADHEATLRALAQTGILPLKDRALSTLSGGERQRAYLAMLLAQEAQTLLLDEPTAHLDVSARLQLLALIRSLRDEGKTVVAILHELDDALQIADEILLLQDGCLRFCGSPQALLETSALDDAFDVKTHVYLDEARQRRYYFTKDN